MSTRIRLRRMGSKGRPFYRVVVADQRAPRDGRFIENIGRYHPLNDPSVIEIDQERALHWLRVGAQPSNQVRNLMEKVGIWSTFVAERPNAGVAAKPRAERPAKEKLSKKAQARAAEGAKAVPATDEPATTAPAEAATEEVATAAADAPEAADAELAADAVEAPAPDAAEESAEG
jgi:small subunit ribosomal protein S16